MVGKVLGLLFLRERLLQFARVFDRFTGSEVVKLEELAESISPLAASP
jgi:hypothetical protein